jgi:hypothetical protein
VNAVELQLASTSSKSADGAPGAAPAGPRPGTTANAP